MAEHDEVDQQLPSKQSTMKKEKLKSKLANSAIAKARAFFRSFELKHRHRQTSSPPSSNEDHPKKDLVLNSISPTTHISISQISRVEKINPRDLIVHRVLDIDDQFANNYFRQKYKQYFKPSLLLPKQYYNGLLNKRNYSSFVNRHDFYSPATTLSPHFRYLPSHNDLPSSSNELCSLERSSMLTWNECVRRLNREYRLTIDALEQAKECLKQVYSDSKYPRNQNLSINETKKSTIVTFCLPSPSSALSISKNSIEQQRILPSVQFVKPKLIKPVELETFSSSLNLESELSIEENEKELNAIQDSPIVIPHIDDKLPFITPHELNFQEEETTYTIETFYTNINHPKSECSAPIDEYIAIVQEKSTEEQFNQAHEQIESNSTISSKPPKKPISQIPKRIPTNTATISRLKQPTKINSFPSKIKPPSTSIIYNAPRKSIGETSKLQFQMKNKSDSSTRVKSIVQQFNSINSSTVNKRIPRPFSIQATTSSKIPGK